MPLRVNDFLSLVLQRTEQLVPAQLAPFSARLRWVWLQIHYWTPRIHYEVWLTRKTGRIEIGLHFEGEREFSYRWAEALAPRMAEVQAALGPQVELEEWTPSWTRIHQTLPYEPLSESLAEAVAERLAATIAVLQPILEEERAKVSAGLAAEPAAQRSGSRPPLGLRVSAARKRFRLRRRRYR